MSSPPRWELACFDLDGTLITGTSISQFLADSLGQREQLLELERSYAAGEISNADVETQTAASLGGQTIEWVSQAVTTVPCISGIDQTVSALRAHNIPAVIATVTWRFAAEIIRERHGFLAACGTEMSHDDDGVLGGEVSRQFDEHDKRRFIEEYFARHGLALDRCIAIGDSRSDVPLFACVGFRSLSTPRTRRNPRIGRPDAVRDVRDGRRALERERRFSAVGRRRG